MEGCPTKLSGEFSVIEPSVYHLPYAGWVPTVSGRLSFRHIGESSHPCKAKYANVAKLGTSRFILAAQIRPLSDVIFGPLIHPLFNLRGDIPFALAARSHQSIDDILVSGNIFLFRSRSAWEHVAAREVYSAISDINDRKSPNSVIGGKTIYQRWKDARTVVRSHSDIGIYFRLMRTGEVFFSRPLFRDAPTEENTSAYSKKIGNDYSYWISNQFYFFLRDISHRHQHHDPHSDTILVLQRREIEKDSMEWRKNIIYSLHYYIIGSKRHGNVPSLVQSLGILAYCESFESISRRYGVLPPYNNEALIQSIDSRIREIENRFNRSAIYFGSIIAILAIICTFFAMLVQPADTASDTPDLWSISKFAAKHFIAIVVSLLVAAFLSYVAVRQAPKSSGFRRGLTELTNAKRHLTMWASFIFSFLIGLESLRFGWPMVKAIANLFHR